MNSWNPRANAIFLEALELPSPESSKAHVDEACGGDAGLCSEVESLLSAGEQAGSFLELPAAPPTAAFDTPRLAEGTGKLMTGLEAGALTKKSFRGSDGKASHGIGTHKRARQRPTIVIPPGPSRQ